NRLEQASGIIAGQLAKTDLPPAQHKSLAQAKLKADFEFGVSLFDMAQTYDDKTEGQERAKIIKRAMEVLKKVAAQEDKNPVCSQARAWLGRCYQDIDDPKNARTELAKVIGEDGPHTAVAKRYARYFRLLTLDKDPDAFLKGTDLLAKKVETALEWLKDY